MIIGIPKEVKNRENRVAIVPGGVKILTALGHKVLIEKGAGVGAGAAGRGHGAGAGVGPGAAEGAGVGEGVGDGSVNDQQEKVGRGDPLDERREEFRLSANTPPNAITPSPTIAGSGT